MINVRNISKKYKAVRALRHLSFSVDAGEIFGIIGPDGAGKTTLFKILSTLILADEGNATINGWDIVNDFKKIRENIGYMPGHFSLYHDLSVEENLKFFATIFNTTVDENYDLIKDIYQQIEPFKKRRAGALSGGMKQKLALSCALIHRPKVLFLDEPTTGVDPVSRKELWEMLKRLKEQGITILVSTPYMDEASLCDRIALIQNGAFLKTDTPQNIVKQYDKTLWSASAGNMSKLLTDIRVYQGITTCFAFGDVHHVTIDNEQLTIENFKLALEKMGHTEVIINEIAPTIEDCFMELTK
jgi:ABC-type multidrug transport system ATPase subunit